MGEQGRGVNKRSVKRYKASKYIDKMSKYIDKVVKLV